jgi:hypothetical protein
MRIMGLKPGVIAVAAFCVTSQAYAPPLNIATGPSSSVDGYLRVGPDEYGSWNSVTFGGLGDTYNPAGPDAGGFGPLEAGFSNGFMIFVGGGRELLSDNASWQGVACAAGTIDSDATLTRLVIVANAASDTNGDAVDDTLTSSFRVFGGSTALQVDVEQEVDSVPGNSIALLTQRYTILNVSAFPATFSLLRIGDFDMLWNGTSFDDSVGTDRAITNNTVFQQEDGTPVTRITMVSVEATDYAGGIRGITPTGGLPTYGFGTDCQEWDNPGLPASWADHIATVGTKTNGESGSAPAGCTGPDCDAHIDLNIPVADLEFGASITITIRHLYGGTCREDCEPLPDGQVGITDFLALLGDWGGASACDFDGGGVGIVDFLKLLANWGPCP